MNDFIKGVLVGGLSVLLVFGVVSTLKYLHKRDKEVIEYAEKFQAVEQLREDYSNTAPAEFIETIPDVRRSADGAAAEFERRRDEALQRFRSKRID